MKATKKRAPRKMSQAEARRLRERVRELEANQRKLFARWGMEIPGTHIGTMNLSSDSKNAVAIRTARLLGYGIAADLRKRAAALNDMADKIDAAALNVVASIEHAKAGESKLKQLAGLLKGIVE